MSKRPVDPGPATARHHAAGAATRAHKTRTHTADTFDWDRAIELLHETLRRVYHRRPR